MDQAATIALAFDPSHLLRAQGMTPDQWQKELLLSRDVNLLLNCSRQSGKSTTVAALALHTALFPPRGDRALILILSPTQRQSGELFRKVKDAYNAIGRPIGTLLENMSTLELANGSRIVALPGREGNIRSFSAVDLLLLDEAAKIPDDVYRAVRPMLAVSHGRLVALSTPFGQRGFFYNEWESNNPWKRVCVTYHDCPRITEDFIKQEENSLGQAWVDQEYRCLFTAMEGLVYPDFHQAITDTVAHPPGRPVGGIDFGWHNPFAAIWGDLDRDDVLWITCERYQRQTPLHVHAAHLRKYARNVMWYADPAGATEINELRCAGLTVAKANNEIRLGIQAVTARIRTGRLKVCSTACMNLIDESRLYRYPTEAERALVGENPIDDNNHALAALRYLIAKLDARFIAKLRKRELPLQPGAVPEKRDHEETDAAVTAGQKPWLRLDNDQLWRPL